MLRFNLIIHTLLMFFMHPRMRSFLLLAETRRELNSRSVLFDFALIFLLNEVPSDFLRRIIEFHDAKKFEVH